MDLNAFKQSLSDKEPPRPIVPPLAALWWAKKDDWDKAHRLIMNDNSAEAAWVHAYLHRVEGDLGNAAYWYAKAQRSTESGPLDAEWEAMVAALLACFSRD